MKTRFSVLAAILALWLCPTAPAQTPPHENAALLYQRAMQRMERLDLSHTEWDLLNDVWRNHTDAPVPDGVRPLLARAEPILSLVRRGADRPVSDFGLDHSQGFEMTLTHLSDVRRLARLMGADAALHLHDGDAYGAANNLAALVNVAGHMPHDGTLISTLVGNAVFHHADGILQTAIDAGALTPDASRRILRSFDDLPAADPMGFTSAIEAERQLGLSSMEDMFDDPAKMAIFFGNDEAVPVLLRGLSGEDAATAIDQYNGGMTEVAAIFNEPDPEKAMQMMKQFEEAIAAGEHGILAQHLMPAFGKCLIHKHRTDAILAARRAMLEDIASGLTDPRKYANAARWYMLAADALTTHPLDELRSLRTVALDHEMPLSADMQTWLDEQAGVRDLLAPVAQMSRCDFEPYRDVFDPADVIVPAYGPRLRDLMHLLMADLRLAVNRGDPDAISHAGAQLLRAVGHFAGNPRVTTGITAHEGLRHLSTTLEDRPDLIDAATRDRLRDLAAALPRGDTFAYTAAARHAGETLAGRAGAVMHHLTKPDEIADASARYEQLTANIEARSPDDRYALLLIWVKQTTRTEATQSARLTARLSEFDDVFDAEAMTQLTDIAPRIQMIIEQLDADGLKAVELPPVAGIGERIGATARDVRTLRQHLMPPPVE